VARKSEAAQAGGVESMIEALKHDDANVRWEAVRALGALRDSRAVEPLLEALGDPDPDVRRKAVLALAKIRDRRAIAGLQACSEKDANQVVRWAASWSLGRFQERKSA
jgi:HEAT repeat protein